MGVNQQDRSVDGKAEARHIEHQPLLFLPADDDLWRHFDLGRPEIGRNAKRCCRG
jgi:hypothetical protein